MNNSAMRQRNSNLEQKNGAAGKNTMYGVFSGMKGMI
jgi:hypothetical protein